MNSFQYQIGNENKIITVAENNSNIINESSTNSLLDNSNEDIYPSILDDINKVDDYINQNSIDADDLQEEEEDLNNNESFPNNDLYFTVNYFIESINNINNAIRHCDNYHFIWSRIKDLEGIESISNTYHKDGPITQKVIPGYDEDMFEDQRKEEMKKMGDLFLHVLDEEGEDNHNNDYCTMFQKLWPEAI